MTRARDLSADVIRGIAVFTMFAANFAAVVLLEPHPFWLRVYGTFAASLFVMVSGMMVTATARERGYGLVHYLRRGGLVLAIAALVDMLIWGYYPFWTFDVLYVIGLGLPAAYLHGKLPTAARWAVPIVIIGATPLLQDLLGYTAYPQEIYFSGEEPVETDIPTGVINHLLVDGWFPLFPWLGLMILGTLLGDLRRHIGSFANARGLGAGIALLVIGIAIWMHEPGRLLVRDGYSELFYEPTIGYAVTAIGVYMVLFGLVDVRPGLPALVPLRLFGETALLMYILHLWILSYILASLFAEQQATLMPFLGIYLGLSLALLAVCWAVRGLKVQWTARPLVARFLLGG